MRIAALRDNSMVDSRRHDVMSCWMSLDLKPTNEKRIRPGTFGSTTKLEEGIPQYLATNNANSKPFVWTKSADQILESVKRYCKRINNSAH
jgi:hypothetical protein